MFVRDILDFTVGVAFTQEVISVTDPRVKFSVYCCSNASFYQSVFFFFFIHLERSLLPGVVRSTMLVKPML